MFDTLAATTDMNISEATPRKHKIIYALNDQMVVYKYKSV